MTDCGLILDKLKTIILRDESYFGRIHKNAHSGAQREKHEEHGGSTGVLAKYLRPNARDSQ